MQDIEERTTIEAVRRARRTGLIALLAIAVLVMAAAGAWLLVRGGEQTATDVIQDYAAAMRADDMASVAGFDATTIDGGFIEWQIALSLEPTFTNCSEIVGAGNTIVSCTITAGDEYFYQVRPVKR